MRGRTAEGQMICDLACKNCDAYVLPLCLLYRGQLGLRIVQSIMMGGEALIPFHPIGFWKDIIVAEAKTLPDLTFVNYPNEKPN
jgi:hypothetical protein